MSKINIEGIVRDIKERSTYLSPIIEAICNSIDAIKNGSTGKIEIIVKRDGQQSFVDANNNGSIIAIDVIDNGRGFDQENRDSFDTFRSGLKYKQGGKGFGRFMYLKYFGKVEVESIYKEVDEFKKRTFSFGHGSEIIENEHIETLTENEVQTGTILHLSSVRNASNIDKGLEVIARKLVERLIVFFINPDTPQIVLREEDGSNSIILNKYISPNSSIVQIAHEKIKECSNNCSYDFDLYIFKTYFSNLASKIILTANNREVTETFLHNYVPEFKETLNEITDDKKQKNYTVSAYVVSDYLDEHVSVERDSFNFPKESNLFEDISQNKIEKRVASILKELFSDSINSRFEKKKKEIENYVTEKAPWHKTLLSEINIEDIPVNFSEEEIETKFQKAKFEKERQTTLAIRNIVKAQNEKEGYENFEEQVEEILKSVTDSSKNDLVHYVCTRKKILDLFDNLRKRTESGRPHLEKEIHNLIFPMINDDRTVSYNDHNLWLLDERLVFSKYIASDKTISKDDTKEPDLAIFYNEKMFYRNGDNVITSPITIYEFKRPKRDKYPDDENPIHQVCRYAQKILNGKYEMPDGLEPVCVDKFRTPVYLYIVCDKCKKIDEFASLSGLTVSPDNEGYFGYIKAYNAYIEIISYKKLIEDAKMRNKIFFHKLGIE